MMGFMCLGTGGSGRAVRFAILIVYSLSLAVAVLGSEFPPGDADCDGSVDERDERALVAAVFNGSDCASADVNEDGEFCAADLPALMRLRVVLAATPTFTQTESPAPTPSPSSTYTASGTATPSETATVSPSATGTSTRTPTGTPTSTQTYTYTRTPSVTASNTRTPTDTATETPSSTPTDTATETPVHADGHGRTPSSTPTDTATETPSSTPTDTVTDTPSSTPTWTATATATNTVTPTATATTTPSRTYTWTPTCTATVTATGTSTWTPTITSTATRTASPTMTPTPSATGTATPSELGPVVSFLGAANADGCPFCCSFSCRATPSPTPLYDAEGRQIFIRSQGRFLLVLEGSRGRSKLDPGTATYPSDPAQRPDPQVLSVQPLGNGSVDVCDTGPPPTGGGVPGVDPPDFREGQDVTDALRDLMCRFSVHNTSNDACTLNLLGNYEFVASATKRQFCFQVPQTVVFPPGDTVLAAQLRDTDGNLGPRKEIVIRVGSP